MTLQYLHIMEAQAAYRTYPTMHTCIHIRVQRCTWHGRLVSPASGGDSFKCFPLGFYLLSHILFALPLTTLCLPTTQWLGFRGYESSWHRGKRSQRIRSVWVYWRARNSKEMRGGCLFICLFVKMLELRVAPKGS